MVYMFYAETIDFTTLRLGDVLEGYIEAIPLIEEPLNDIIFKGYKYDLKIHNPSFSIVMTPCCSIGQNTISLAPLRKITSDIFKDRNSKVIEDFTLLNSEIETKDIVSEEIWNNRYTPELREKYELEGKKWAYIDLFFYSEYNIFEEYEVEVKYSKDDIKSYKTRYYMVDFKNISQLRCNKIITNQIHDVILKTKCLELSINAREQLREKITNYYGRIPDEDLI
ncbi:MAG: hypothetical protein ACFFA0_03755 [Promethearchaeota archaeon]